MGNLNRRNAAFEIVPWAAPASQGEFGFGDLVGRIGSGIGDVAGRVIDTVRGAGIIDLTAQADKSVRKGPRDLKKVRALVLHQMACCHRRKDPLKDYLRLKAHFAILPDGRILQIHPVRDLVWASNGFNACSVAVEFAGNFPNTKGKWWEGAKFGRNQVTPAQIEAGRRLVRHLVGTIGLRAVLAHRQSSATRENDPGPDIWHHVGQWAVDNLGLKDGGPGFKVGDGNPIPDLWRTWGRVRPAVPVREAEFGEAEQEEVVFGPLNATLKWEGPYTYDQVKKLDKFNDVGGGVYIAFRPPTFRRKICILKVGMAGTFARRMKDREYVLLSQQHPDLRFFLAEVRGDRGTRGIGGVVQMVEFALTRLLLRAGHSLPASKTLRVPSRTLGAVRVENVLPEALKEDLKPVLALVKPAPPRPRAAGSRPIPPATPFPPVPPETPALTLVLPASPKRPKKPLRWEAEQFPQG